MRLSAVPGVATGADDNALLDMVADGDLDGAPTKMREKNERAIGAGGDHNVVSGDGGPTTSGATGLAKHVEQEVS